jgi:glycosyltransferase involved in cell wall biosynthesis
MAWITITIVPHPSLTCAQSYPINPDEHPIILYPHRPEDAKGIRQTIALTARLVHDYGLSDVRVFVPRWIDTGLSASVKAYYDDLLATMEAQGVRENFVFHEWVSDTDMPQFYSMGALTVALGNYVETFGNTPYESLACGTPIIASRVGTYREMLPEEHVTLVDYDDIETAAQVAADIIRNQKRVTQTTLDWLHTNFDLQTMVQAYADIILNAQTPMPMPYMPQLFTAETRFELAPWCYVSPERGIYHDFRAEYQDDTQLLAWAKMGVQLGDDEAVIMHWYREGYLVPARDT